MKADVYLTDLQVVELAGFSVQMIETPGHTLGSCCYYLKDEGVLFSGDTVFCGSVGRTDFPEGSTAAIVKQSAQTCWMHFRMIRKFIRDMIRQQRSVMKRGIIHLYKIGILFQDREFEHDIYELIRAFYPGSEIAFFL